MFCANQNNIHGAENSLLPSGKADIFIFYRSHGNSEESFACLECLDFTWLAGKFSLRSISHAIIGVL